MPSTYEQRKETLRQVVQDTLLDPRDQFKFIYHWMMNEYTLIKIVKLERRQDKHAKQLRNLCTIFNARHELQDL
jgi:hypothetical protein